MIARDFPVSGGSAADLPSTQPGTTVPVAVAGGDTPYDFHLAGNSWTASQPSGRAHGFTTTVENDSLAGTFTFDDGAYYKYRLQKN